jgi:hypothetical protein
VHHHLPERRHPQTVDPLGHNQAAHQAGLKNEMTFSGIIGDNRQPINVDKLTPIVLFYSQQIIQTLFKV